jgi:hypothetical protein
MTSSVTQGNDSEKVLGVMPWLTRTKILGVDQHFSQVITTQRMIFAQETSEMRKSAYGFAKEKVKAEGKAEDQGFFSRISSLGHARFDYYVQKYRFMEPSTILSETPGNFAVDNNDVKEIKVRHISGFLAPSGEPSHFMMEIASGKAKYTFKMDEFMRRGVEEYIKLLKQVYLEKVDARGF